MGLRHGRQLLGGGALQLVGSEEPVGAVAAGGGHRGKKLTDVRYFADLK